MFAVRDWIHQNESKFWALLYFELTINVLQAERDHLQQKVVSLESELETTTEAALELNKLLNDFLSSQQQSIDINSSVDILQQQIAKQSQLIAQNESTASHVKREVSDLLPFHRLSCFA